MKRTSVIFFAMGIQFGLSASGFAANQATVYSFATIADAGADVDVDFDSISSLTGTLFAMGGIGGESTGFGIVSDKGSFEIDLETSGMASQFIEGRKVRVTGFFETRYGIEIPARQVFVVTKLVELTKNTDRSIEIRGPKAEAVVDALSKTILTSEPIGTGIRYRLTELNCQNVPRGFVYAECTFDDEVVLKPMGAYMETALGVQNALVAAGVKETRDSTGGIDRFSIFVKSIVCTSGEISAGAHCVIECS